MGYRIDIDHAGCINCGVCMDVCPVQALDMTRPDHPGIEAGPGGGPLPWTMEHPVQVGECIGCSICIRECPVEVMDLVTVDGPTPLAERQGPITRPEPTTGWIPWSAVTREALKPTRVSPFEGGWQTQNRPKPWQVWSTMVEPDVRPPAAPCQEACPAGTDAGRYVGLIAQGRYDDAERLYKEVLSRPRSTRSRRSAAGSAPRPARRPAGAARSTSRSRSGRSSASPPSTAPCRRSIPPRSAARSASPSSAAAPPACRPPTT